ncbi:MAG: pirin family protein [Bacilli bacterium]|nr:pirin family protein [Bacilli bacterium]
MKRTVTEQVKGYRTTDGAGVSLVRVLGGRTTATYDPILMLDSFDSVNPEDYTAGFPLHPHRGIETISLIVKGNMVHKDSLGNAEAISDGEVQWMTAGSGILHEEMLPASERMLGVQLWLNMPKQNKMAPPEYRSIRKEEIEEIQIENGTLRLISGTYKDHEGFKGKYLPLDYYHILLNANSKFTIEMEEDKSVMVFLLVGDAKVAGETISEKTAVKVTSGDTLDIESLNEDTQILFISSDKLEEPIAWGGPIVMNIEEELNLAFEELENGTFIKEKVEY